MRQIQAIRASWSEGERRARAELGAARRAELCQQLFGEKVALI